MTVEEYVNNLKLIVNPTLVEATKDWSDSDKMYVFLHSIQIQQMEEFKILLKEFKEGK